MGICTRRKSGNCQGAAKPLNMKPTSKFMKLNLLSPYVGSSLIWWSWNHQFLSCKSHLTVRSKIRIVAINVLKVFRALRVRPCWVNLSYIFKFHVGPSNLFRFSHYLFWFSQLRPLLTLTEKVMEDLNKFGGPMWNWKIWLRFTQYG